MRTDDDIDAALATRLRTTLSTVAAAVTAPDDQPAAPVAQEQPMPTQTRSRPRLAVLGAAAVATLSVAAFGYAKLGPEYVTALPPPNVMAAGEESGIDFWLVPSFHQDNCDPDRDMPGVELVSAASNTVGGEWHTGGFAYGEADDSRAAAGCVTWDQQPWLADPTLVALGSTRLDGDDGPWGGHAAVHPSVTTLVITTPGEPAETIDTHPRPDAPDGPRYAAWGLPENATEVRIELQNSAGETISIEQLEYKSDRVVRTQPSS